MNGNQEPENASSTQSETLADRLIKGKALKYMDPAVLSSKLVLMTRDPNMMLINRLLLPHLKTIQNVLLSVQEARAVLTQYYHMIIKGIGSLFDFRGVQPTLPQYYTLEQKCGKYEFTDFPRDANGLVPFPPHLRLIPKESKFEPSELFNNPALTEIGLLLSRPSSEKVSLFAKLQRALGDMVQTGMEFFWTSSISEAPFQKPSIQAIEEYNKEHHKSPTDIHYGKNLGMLEDWYSDRRFADQAFTGVDPTTIERASDDLYDEFLQAAVDGGYKDWAEKLPQIKPELFVTDCSWFRKAVGAQPHEELKDNKKDNVQIWACASVTLYHLQGNGQLHPVAIVLDYKGSMRDSVTIFNRAMESLSPEPEARRIPEQEEDWPWRYAKMCAQVSSYIRHEVGTHLTLAHFAEEAIIVATHRTIPMEHIVYRLLEPHWYKTLSLNATARTILVPDVIRQITGLKEDQLSGFIRHTFTTMDYTQGYVPKDLKRRGFPDTIEGLDDRRYRDYAYAKGILRTWNILQTYVRAMLLSHYKEDEADENIATDEAIANWCKEVQNAAHIPTFPTIKTLDALVDAITMSIHIAAPFHSAVNYLQNYYLSFVPARPPSLSAPPPNTLDELRAFKEDHIVGSLPMGQKRQWLLAAQVPWLLSFKVGEEHNLKTFAASQYMVHLGEEGKEAKVRAASEQLYNDLLELEKELAKVRKGMHEGCVQYTVLDPDNMALSVLI